MDYLTAIIIAIIEGFTEFLPISSTAHIVFTSILLKIPSDNFLKIFGISIQLSAILAVLTIYYKKFFNFHILKFYIKLIIALIPAIFFGFLLSKSINNLLESENIIAIVLIIGGIILLLIEKYFKNPLIFDEANTSNTNAFFIGLWQCIAMIPGVSRSAATIIGGMQQGLSKKAATEFSFFLAVPTMFAATCYSIFIEKWEEGNHIMRGYQVLLSSYENYSIFIVGNLFSYIVALFAIKFFLTIVIKYGLKPWGWYRIIVGISLLIYFNCFM